MSHALTHRQTRIKAVVMDVDGTLASSDHALSERTRRAVARLQAYGLAGIIVTGRTERSAVATASACGLVAPVISAGGAVTTDPVTLERLLVSGWPPSGAWRVAEVAWQWGCQPLLWTIEHPYAEVESPYVELLRRVVGEQVKITLFKDLIASKDIIKVTAAGSPELLDEVGHHMEGVVPELKRSTPEFYDAPPPGSSKKEALDRVLASLDVRHDECVGIADGDTDIEWMAGLGHPVAVANASSGVLGIATEVIGDHSDDGVARYLEETLLRADPRTFPRHNS